jgi:hypothetical protein
MYTHVSKCKNDKIKKLKFKEKEIKITHEFIQTNIALFESIFYHFCCCLKTAKIN